MYADGDKYVERFTRAIPISHTNTHTPKPVLHVE
jgi:hypothetical protein